MTLREHPQDGEWMAWLDDELATERRSEMASHLDECSTCRLKLDGLGTARDFAALVCPRLPEGYVREARAAFFQALPERLDWENRAACCFGRRLPAGSSREAARVLLGSGSASGAWGWLPGTILHVVAACFALAAVAWGLWIGTGEWSYAEAIFGMPYTAFLVFAAATGVVLAYAALNDCDGESPVRSAWELFLVAAICRLAGTILGRDTGAIRQAGEFIAGPAALAAMGFGLLHARGAYRSLGLHSSLRLQDWALIAAAALLAGRHLAEVTGILFTGPAKSPLTVLNWSSDLALLFVVATAVPLMRIASEQGGGFVARCWQWMAAGAMLTLFANFLLFLTNYGYLAWPWSSVLWLAWIPAYGAFVLSPAYQLAANSCALRPAPQSEAAVG